MHSSKVQLSPVSNGVSKRIGYSVSSTPLPSSTPLTQNTLFTPPRISPLRHPPRYFLSNASPTRSPVTPVKPARPIQKSSGPLLASTRFNVNLGTYTDSKSPGLTSRIVQYDKEAKEKCTPTHQAKYGSPGVFPVVHFFKKEIPVISPKAKRVTVRLASPDGNFYSTSKYSRCLSSEALSEVRNGFDREMRQTNTSTRSVLDALKEISRKRIHTSSDFETNQESTKRQRVDCIDNAYENNKRAREESPLQEPNNVTTTSPSQSAPKKICVVDVLAASYTSSNLLKEQLEKGLKRKTELEENQKNKLKEIKLIHAETQTQNIENKSELAKQLQEVIATGKLNELEAPSSEKKEEARAQNSPTRYVNIFNEKRLEVNRKNKLATLLSAITGEPPKLIPHESLPKPKEDCKLVSILSPQNKPKHDKHVSFNLPPEKKDEVAVKKSTDDASESNSSFTSESLSSVATHTSNSSTQVTSSIPNPVMSSVGGFVLKPQETVDAAVISTSATIPSEPTLTTSPSKPTGGFKFDLSKTPTTSSSFLLGVTQNKFVSSTSQADSKPFGDGSKTTETYNFGLKSPVFGGEQMVPSLPTSSNLANAATSSPVLLSAMPLTSAMTVTSPYSFTNSVNFGGKTTTFTTTPLSTLTVAFPAITSAPKFIAATTTSNPVFGGTATSTITFAAKPSTTSAFNFGNTSTSASNFGTTSTAASNFGTTATSASNFGTMVTSATPLKFGSTATSVPNFGTPTTSSTMFGVKSSSSTPIFGGVTTTTSTPIFGGVATTASIPIFGGVTTTTSTPMFGVTTTTSIPMFGIPTSTSTSAFGTTMSTSTSMFGTTTSTSAPLFGTITSASTPMFGTTTITSTPKFGTSSSAPMFGGAVTSTSTPSSFGTATISAFNTVPNFASGFNSPSNFNAPNNFPTTVTTTTAPFTSPATFTNSAITFGTPVTSFGGSDTMFNAPTSTGGTTKQPFGFPPTPSLAFRNNVTSAPTFGTNNVTSTSSSFTPNTSVPSFGTNSAPAAFGTNPATTAPPSFGTNPATTAPPSFGTNPVTTAPPSFGTPAPPSFSSNLVTSTSAPMFGTNSTTFGSNTNVPNAGFGGNSAFNSGAPSFGTPVTTSSSGFPTSKPFSFGPNTFVTNSTTSFNFTPKTSTSIFNTPKTAPSFATNFGPSPNQNVNFGPSTLQQTSPPSNPFGAPPNAFPFQAAQGNFNNKNTAFNNSFSGNTSGFGSGEPQNVGFGSPNNTTGYQFNNASAFDANNAANNTSGAGLFTFGSNNPTSTPASGVFTFGSGDSQKPNFNFPAGSPAAFGGAPPNFGNNFASSPAGMFSIGSGSSTTNRSRTQFKVKRRN